MSESYNDIGGIKAGNGAVNLTEKSGGINQSTNGKSTAGGKKNKKSGGAEQSTTRTQHVDDDVLTDGDTTSTVAMERQMITMQMEMTEMRSQLQASVSLIKEALSNNNMVELTSSTTDETNTTRNTPARTPRRNRRSRSYNSSSEDEVETGNGDDGSENDSDNITEHTVYCPTYTKKATNTKLPPFTDKETWKIWYSRFETVADRNR